MSTSISSADITPESLANLLLSPFRTLEGLFEELADHTQLLTIHLHKDDPPDQLELQINLAATQAHLQLASLLPKALLQLLALSDSPHPETARRALTSLLTIAGITPSHANPFDSTTPPHPPTPTPNPAPTPPPTPSPPLPNTPPAPPITNQNPNDFAHFPNPAPAHCPPHDVTTSRPTDLTPNVNDAMIQRHGAPPKIKQNSNDSALFTHLTHLTTPPQTTPSMTSDLATSRPDDVTPRPLTTQNPNNNAHFVYPDTNLFSNRDLPLTLPRGPPPAPKGSSP